MEERHGWERPGWYLKDTTAPIAPYDYYGSYGTTRNENHKYEQVLKQGYTFDFPEHQTDVRIFGQILICGYVP